MTINLLVDDESRSSGVGLSVVSGDLSEVDQQLDALAAVVRSESQRILNAEVTALRHAILAGKALWDASKLIGDVNWASWLENSCDVSRETANRYMRFAYYEDQLRSDMTITEAREFLKGLPATRPSGRTAYSTAAHVRREARQLHREGKTVNQIADYLEVNWNLAKALIDPDYEKRRKAENREGLARRRRARAALREKEKADRVKRAGGAVSRAYSYVRKALPDLEQAIKDSDGDERRALEQALHWMHKTEDAISKAVRLGGR